MPDTPTSCINIPEMPTHCAACGAEYRNIQHPLKPPGVIMTRECDCKPVFTQVAPGFTTVTMVPPKR
jgi:hypothetical protein